MINVLADRHLVNIRSYLPENINLQLFDPDAGLPPEINRANGLLVRTVIPINKKTLSPVPENLSFVGSASAGFDHVDLDYLQQHNIQFGHSPGCNARSVAEYVATALLLWANERDKNLNALSVGIIGVGNVGTQVAQILNELAIPHVTYDPPREHRDPGFESAKIDKVLNCDILTFHTPLTMKTEYATYHWLNANRLENQVFHLIINSSRGGVLHEQAVLQAKKEGRIRDLVIDVWEDEPEFHLDTAWEAFLKTPHIAGYSVQAKNNASRIVANNMLEHFGLEQPTTDPTGPPRIFEGPAGAFDSLSELLTELHPIRKYEKRLIEIIEEHPSDRGPKFNELRATYPLRQEFGHTHLADDLFNRFPVLESLGFARIGNLE